MTVTKQLIDNVNKIKTTLNEISVYNLDVKTSLELYYELAKKVNEVINELSRFEGVVSDEVVEQNKKLIYLLGEGLKEQVGLKIDELITNGTMDSIINHKIFNDLNTKIETYKQQTDEQFNTKASKQELEVERQRINNFTSLAEGSTTGDAELIDGRISFNGITYDNIGNAIRGQSSQLFNDINVTKLITNSKIYNKELLLNFKYMDIYSDKSVINSNGVVESSNSNKVLFIESSNIRSIKMNLKNPPMQLVLFALYDKNDNLYPKQVYTTLNYNNVEFTIPKQFKDGKILVNWYDANKENPSLYCDEILINFDNILDDNETINLLNNKINKIETFKYHHCVDKPFNFNGKKALFFGDSITKGYTSGSTTTTNGYPKLFSDKVGMTFTNYGVGGSCLSYNYNSLGSILDKIKSVGTLTSDFLFVAGGVNDWQLAVDLDTFKDGVVAICEYLKLNYTGKVMFITPINHGGRTPIKTPIADLQEYRNIITETVMCYSDYSVIQGNLFNMPNEKSSDDYINTMFGDKLHPTELGYTVYARDLATILV